MILPIKIIEDGKKPEYKTDGAVGADCFARINNDMELLPGNIQKVPLGFAVEIPEGYEIQIRPRSGLSLKGIVGIVGTIDVDYRGEVNAILINMSKDKYVLHKNDRIAQIVISPIQKGTFIVKDNLSETDRGGNGFGSTGVRKFYKPFTKIEEVQKYVNKRIRCTCNGFYYTVRDAVKNRNTGAIDILITENNDTTIIHTTVMNAFNIYTLDGHPFGQELE